MKTYAEWSASHLDLSRFLSPGDQVDRAMLDYVIGCLPPIQRPGGWLAMGEPYSDDAKGRPTYLAFQRNVYRGPMAVADMTN